MASETQGAALRSPTCARGARIIALGSTFNFLLIVGALLTFGPTALYVRYGGRPAAWGFSLLEDQQLFGLLMMTAGAMMYLMATVVLFAVWFRQIEEDASGARASRPCGAQKGVSE